VAFTMRDDDRSDRCGSTARDGARMTHAVK